MLLNGAGSDISFARSHIDFELVPVSGGLTLVQLSVYVAERVLSTFVHQWAISFACLSIIVSRAIRVLVKQQSDHVVALGKQVCYSLRQFCLLHGGRFCLG